MSAPGVGVGTGEPVELGAVVGSCEDDEFGVASLVGVGEGDLVGVGEGDGLGEGEGDLLGRC